MVRLAQDWNLRYRLVTAGQLRLHRRRPRAAYRYTEARLTNVAEAMLADIDKETVDFRDNFDGTMQDPRCCRPRCRTWWSTAPLASLWAWRAT